MLKKHLKKAAALLVSIATILGTLPTMAASNEEEMIEESAVTTVTDNEAKKLSSDEALDMLKSESQIKADEDNAAEKEKADALKDYLSEMNIPVTAKEYEEQNGEVTLQDDSETTETAKQYTGSWRNDNVSIYKPFKHQHLAEIRQTLTSMQTSFSSKIEFIPVRGCFSRGIFASAYLDCPVALDEIVKLYEDYYDDHNFTYVINRMPDLKDVVNTNKCLLYLTKEDGKLLIVSVIDNLLKGASGQAVHNMNLLFGLHERTGLNLKASAF